MKLSDNEIIKALENLTYGGHSCGKCKHQVKKGDERCGIKGCNIARNALDLINRIKAEKETFETLANEYKDKVELLEIEKSAMQHRIDEQQAEYERLQIAAQPYLDEIEWEISGEAFRKIRHHSLCETETFEGRCNNEKH